MIPANKDNWKHTSLDTNTAGSELSWICDLFYKKTAGFVRLMHRAKNVVTRFYEAQTLRENEFLKNIIEHFPRSNLYISTCTFRTKNNGRQDNLQAVCALTVDCDYQDSQRMKISQLPVLEAVRYLFTSGVSPGKIPAPSYVEIGHCFRLVYVLNTPFVISKDKKKATSSINFLKRLGKCLCEKVSAVDDFGVDRFKLSCYVRVPEGINRQSEGHYDYALKQYVVDRVTDYIVTIPDEFIRVARTGTCTCPEGCRYQYQSECTSDSVLFGEAACPYISFKNRIGTWDINALAALILPDLPNWYEGWKQRKDKKKKSKGPPPSSLKSFLEHRLKDLEELQMLRFTGEDYKLGSRDYRELLTYLYRLTAVQSGLSDAEALEKTIRFASGFDPPLERHTVEVKCRPSSYKTKFKDSTIREMLGLKDNEFPKLLKGQGSTRKERYEKEKENAIRSGYVTKKSKINDECKLIGDLLSEGYSRKEIAQKLSLSESTLSRRIREMDSGCGEASPHN